MPVTATARNGSLSRWPAHVRCGKSVGSRVRGLAVAPATLFDFRPMPPVTGPQPRREGRMRKRRLSDLWSANAWAVGAAAEALLETRRPDMARSLSARERGVDLVAATGFVVVASALAATDTPYNHVSVGQAAALLGTFVLLARVRFAVGAGFIAPTQLAVVPILLLLPPGLAPAMIGLGFALDCLIDVWAHRRPLERLLTSLMDGWYVVAPAMFLAAVAPRGALRAGWLVWLAALGLELGGELVSTAICERLARGVPVLQQAAVIGEVALIDVLLSPVGLLGAFASESRRYAFLLAMPLVAGFWVFARDRAGRISRALALADELHRERDAVLASQEELRASRARLVHIADAERRRIERDLHDGAQQRLAGLLLKTKLRRRSVKRAVELEPILDELEQGLSAALVDLRTLAAGILPPVLSDHGLPAALEELAASMPLPLAVRADGVGRLPPHIEQAAYFVVAEALANVIKHAEATKAFAHIVRENGTLTVEIADDGIGGATTAAGTGLRGLMDRVGAVDGRLNCSSPPGGGTVLRAEIPCSS